MAELEYTDIVRQIVDSEENGKPYDIENIDKIYAYCKWYSDLRSTTVDKFFPLYECEKRYIVMMGGGGSGKSIFCGRKILERISSESGHIVLVVRKYATSLRNSCWRQINKQIDTYYGRKNYKFNETRLEITCKKTGSMIIMSGLDDVEKLKSIVGVTIIWVEEATEISKDDFNQLDIRLRDESTQYKQFLISFNPTNINHWLKSRFFDDYYDDVETSHSTYKDNKFIDESAKKVLENFKYTDPYYYQVYCLGQWGVLGDTIFDAMAISERMKELQEPVAKGYFEYTRFENGKVRQYWFTESESAEIKIYEKPIKNHPYVIAGDTAGEGSDYYTAQVIDNSTGKQVATLRRHYDDDIYAYQVLCLGYYYNYALIGVEANFSTYPILKLEQMGYKNQYVRETVDSYTHKNKKSFGFRTDSQTRPVILGTLVEFVREHVELINDKLTLEEMLTFVRNEKGRPEAVSGSHDDLVMALAIVYTIRTQQTTVVKGQFDDMKSRKEFKDRKKQNAINVIGLGQKEKII